MSKADNLKKKQSKLTTAANAIQTELLTYTADTQLLTKEEIQTLRDAVSIIRSSKEKYVHQKEKEKRAESQRKRQITELKAHNHNVVCRVHKRLGIKSKASLLFYQYSFHDEGWEKLHPEKQVPAYFSNLLDKARLDHDAFTLLVREIDYSGIDTLQFVIIPAEFRVYRGSLEEDGYDPHFYPPKELTDDALIEVLKTRLNFSFSEEAQTFIDEVERLAQLSNDITKNLLEIGMLSQRNK
ncbi:hypothetical protein [Vibrio sp. R78045]|uniref:hypothetical protein n=1 Tax=Vibrio sp. R78045 TaxID=3093868 RepID=UPI0036F2B7E0